jgi:hypothetical protein
MIQISPEQIAVAAASADAIRQRGPALLAAIRNDTPLAYALSDLYRRSAEQGEAVALLLDVAIQAAATVPAVP